MDGEIGYGVAPLPGEAPPRREGSWPRWLVCGCAGCGALSVAGAALIVVGFFVLLFGMIKSSGAYREALAVVKADEQVKEVLGEPVEEGLFVWGSVKSDDETGSADLNIPVSGPKCSATVRVLAHKAKGQWIIEFLSVEPETDDPKETLVLIDERNADRFEEF